MKIYVAAIAVMCGMAGVGRGAATVQTVVGDATVEIVTVPGGFRMAVSFDGKPVQFHSTFVAPDVSGPDGHVVQLGDWMGITSGDGRLLLNPKTRQWRMQDATGKEVVPVGPIGELKTNTQTGKPWTVLEVACGAKPFMAYGCGDGADSLQQDHGTAALGNGHAVQPSFWSDAGYSVLAVSGDDTVPANWTASPQLGEVRWVFPGQQAELYLLPAGTMREGVMKLATLEGTAPVPPRWTFGYLQSRWGWKDRGYVEDTLKEFQTRKLPVDAFIFDFEWYTKTPDYQVKAEGIKGFSDFEFNDTVFPDPKGQIAALHAAGVHVVGIRKPRLGDADALTMARGKDWILPAGSTKIDARVLDYSKPEVRAWYAEKLQPLLDAGIDGWWDDEGELTYSLYFGWDQAEREALSKQHPEKRLWTIDRAFSPGLARLGAAAWTGDIHATWEDFHRAPTHLLNWSVAGMPYGACDIGGFSGGTTPQLLTRWMEAGVFFPVMRTHSTLQDQPHFPWLYGQAEEAAMRKALELRYRLIPYYYSLAHETQETGLPMMRPLAMEFPGDKRCANLSDEWMVGDGLLAAPMLDASEERSVYLPTAATWYPLEGGKVMKEKEPFKVAAKLDEIPVYVRAGTILPLGPVVQNTSELPGGPLELRVYPGKDAMFELVEDDGDTDGYLKGEVRRTVFDWNDEKRTLTWRVNAGYEGKDIFTQVSVRMMDSGQTREVAIGGGDELRMNK